MKCESTRLILYFVSRKNISPFINRQSIYLKKKLCIYNKIHIEYNNKKRQQYRKLMTFFFFLISFSLESVSAVIKRENKEKKYQNYFSKLKIRYY